MMHFGTTARSEHALGWRYVVFMYISSNQGIIMLSTCASRTIVQVQVYFCLHFT